MRIFWKKQKKIYIRNYFAGGKRKLNVESRFIDWSQPAGKWREREYKRFLTQCARRTDEMKKPGYASMDLDFRVIFFFPSWIPFIVSRASSYYNFKVVASEKKMGKSHWMLYARTSSWIFQRSFDHLIKWEKNDVEAPQKVHIFLLVLINAHILKKYCGSNSTDV